MPAPDAKTDLHTHSSFSDGVLSPEKLLEEAQWNGITALALTDHDTVEGLDEFCSAAPTFGIEAVRGVELSCEHEGLEAHIVGLFVEPDELFLKELEKMRSNRQERMRKMVRKLELMGMKVSMDDLPNDGCLGRPHLARLLVKQKICRNITEAFERYIGDNGPAYVPKERWTVTEGIEMIHRVKGVSVLAHPGASGLIESIPTFVELGIMGIEARYPKHSPRIEKMLEELCRQHDLLVCGGSDYHSANAGPPLGVPYVPYELLEKIRERRGG